jgi:hypothetical protein
MKRVREASPRAISTGGAAAQSAARANADYRAFSNLKTRYRQRFAEYLFDVWLGTKGVRSAVFVVANKRAVLTLSPRKDGVYQTNLNNPDPKFMHLAILNEATDAVQFSITQGVPYEFPPSNQSVARAVSSLANFVPLEYLPPQIQPRPVVGALGENPTKRFRELQGKPLRL